MGRYLVILITVISLISQTTSNNLVINGDFEHHPPIAKYNSWVSKGIRIYYMYVNSLDYAWYDKHQFKYEFQQYVTANTTTMLVDLCTTQSTLLCQDIYLENSLYILEYDLCKNPWRPFNYYSLYLGGKAIVQKQKIVVASCNKIKYTISYQQEGVDSLCFEGFQYLNTTKCYSGPFLDNVTLFKISTHQIVISLQIQLPKNLSKFIIIQTNLTLQELPQNEPFTLSKISQLFSFLQIDGQRKNFKLSKSSLGTLAITIDFQENLHQKNITISINETLIGYDRYVFQSGNVLYKQYIIDLNEEETRFLEMFLEINKPLTERVRDSIRIGRILGIGYLFVEIFSFWQIAIFHSYIFIKIPYFVKLFAENNFKSFLDFQTFKYVQMDEIVYNSFSLPLNQKIPKSQDQWEWFQQLGFTSNFYNNNIECITLLGIGLLRSGLMHLIYLITGWKYFKMNDHWFSNFIIDVVTWAPFLIIPPIIMMNNDCIRNFSERINFMLNTSLVIVCAIFPFLLLIKKSQIAKSMNKHKQMNTIENLLKKSSKKSIKEATNRVKQSFYEFLRLIFVILLTFATALRSKDMFLVISLVLIAVQIWYTIKIRRTFSKIEFITIFSLQLLWVLYTSIFICYRMIQIMEHNSVISMHDQSLIQIVKYLGFTSIALFTLGGWMEVFYLLLIFVMQIKEILSNIIKFLKMKIFPKKVQDSNEQKLTKENNKQQTNKLTKRNVLFIKAQKFQQSLANQLSNQPMQKKNTVSLEQTLKNKYNKSTLQIHQLKHKKQS